MTTAFTPDSGLSLESLIELLITDPRAVVGAGVRVGVFTELAQGPGTAHDLQRALGLSAGFTADFLDALTGLYLIVREGDLYRNSPLADAYLDRAKPAYAGEFIEQIVDSTAQAWGQFADALRGQPLQAQDRGGFAGGMNGDRDRARRFMATMDALNGRIGACLAERLDWSRYRTFADLGGARGNLAAVILRAHPHLRGLCVDLPAAQPFFDEHVRELGLAGRVEFQAADLLRDPVPAADVLIYGQVLHGYGEPDRKALLERAARALPGDGELVIYDRMIDDDRPDVNRLLYSLYMRLVSPSGSEYRSAECVAWLHDLGFSAVTVESALTTHSLIRARR